MKRQKLAPILRSILTACAGWIVVCQGYRLNPDPLALGMTAQDAANSLRAPLVYVTGPSGGEIFYSDRRAEVAGLGPVVERTFLQFRHSVLLGWTSGWQFLPRDDALE